MENIIKKFEKFGSKRGLREVFSDFFELVATGIRVTTINREIPSEKIKMELFRRRYLSISTKYTKAELDEMDEIFEEIILKLESNFKKKEFVDILSPLYQHFEQHSKENGQFFTPLHISKLIAQIVTSEKKMLYEYNKTGSVHICDPRCGAGAILIESVNAAVKEGIPLDSIFVEGYDLSRDCCNMCYIQLSLYGVNATIKRRNALAKDLVDIYITPTMKWRRIPELMKEVMS